MISSRRRHHVRVERGRGRRVAGTGMLHTGQRLHASLCMVSSTVWVRVYPGVTSELVGPAEAFGTTRKGACMRLLSGMGANMPGLMLETMECLVAKRAFIGSWHFTLTLLLGGKVAIVHRLRHYCGGCHFVCGRRRRSPLRERWTAHILSAETNLWSTTGGRLRRRWVV